VELLGATLGDQPYLAFYFRNAKAIRQETLDYLIAHDADPNMPDSGGVYPIHWAIRNFGPLEVAALLQAGADPDKTVSGKSLEIGDLHSDFLAGKGYGVINMSSRGSIWNSIALSVYLKKPEILSLFIDGLDPTASAWLWTAKDAPKDQLSLIELPFWQKQFDPDGITGGAAGCFAVLWKKNMSLPEAQRAQLSPDYEGPLLATLEDDLPALKRFLASDMENSEKYLPYAIVGGALSCLDFLMKYNDLNAQSFAAAFDLNLVHGAPTDAAPLYSYALMDGDIEMLEWFGDRGADFNKSFRYDWRADGGAVMHGQSGALSAAIRENLGIDFISYLLSKGADPNAAEGSTPLLLALAGNREDLASVLLDAGAGPNARVGSKTVLLQVLAGLRELQKGVLALDSAPLDQASLRAHWAGIGWVPQEAFLFSDTLRENLAMGRPGATEEELWEVARVVCLDDLIRRLPMGLDTVVGERGVVLSGGERASRTKRPLAVRCLRLPYGCIPWQLPPSSLPVSPVRSPSVPCSLACHATVSSTRYCPPSLFGLRSKLLRVGLARVSDRASHGRRTE